MCQATLGRALAPLTSTQDAAYRPTTMMRRMLLPLLVTALFASVSCGGSSKPARGSNDSMDSLDEPRGGGDITGDDVDQSDLGKSGDDDSRKAKKSGDDDSHKAKKSDDADGKKKSSEPEFKEGGSVKEAIAAAQGTENQMIEKEVLDAPLLEMSLYAACKLTPANHFKIDYSVWDGRIVGMDITSTPKNPKLEECVRNAAMQAKWRTKAKGLNSSTVMF
jgi:hypothetical protein